MAARRQAHDESSYDQGGDGIYVNLFLPSKLTWTQNGSRSSLTQATQYPKLSVTELRFQLPRSENFTFHLRVPAWSDSKTRISVNGKLAEGEPTPGKFFAVSRTWKDGDRLDFENWNAAASRSSRCAESRSRGPDARTARPFRHRRLADASDARTATSVVSHK